jgi:hypothetical protein
MGHHISAVLLRGPFDEQKARSFDFKPFRLGSELTLFPLYPAYTDFWSEKLGTSGWLSKRPLLNGATVHHLIRSIAVDPLFAIIETDYAGGVGTQAAAVYRGEVQVMAPEVSESGKYGPINKALRHLGVAAGGMMDEFDTVGLGQYRDFDDLFESYTDES